MVLFAALVVLAVPASGAMADEAPTESQSALRGPEDCESGYFCTWTSANFQGERTSWPCGGPGDNGAWTYSSLKNRCASRPVYYSYPHNGSICTNAGQNQSNYTSSIWNAGALNTKC